MTPLHKGIDRLRKAVRSNNVARLSEAVGIAFNQLDGFANGSLPERLWRDDWEDKLNSICDYFSKGIEDIKRQMTRSSLCMTRSRCRKANQHAP